MGLLTSLRAAFGGLVPGGEMAGAVRFTDYRGLFEDYVQGLSPEDMFRTQPHLRTVISFLARNIAQLGVHTFERVSDTDRRRSKDNAVAETLKAPNAYMTTYDLIYRLVADLALYDEALWVMEQDFDRESGWSLQPIPPTWIVAYGGATVFGYDWVDIQPPGTVRPKRITRENFLYFHGWDPSNLAKGTTPISALRATLQEQVNAIKYRDQIWKRAGRVGLTVTRPAQEKGSNWSPETKRKFKEILDSKLAGNEGADAGGSIILEDGMTMQRVGFSAHEEEFIEGAKLALSTVAQVYHVNPTMVGLLDNANFSNVKEFRRMLYGETLGPILAQIEDALNAYLVPRLAPDQGLYLEFNIGEKLQGSFEEQAAVMMSATGRPWQTVNEARARFNMSAIDGGDDLSVPLNVIVGGGTQAAPNDSAPKGLQDLGELIGILGKTENGMAALKSLLGGEASPKALAPPLKLVYKGRAPATYETNIARILKNHYARQRRVVTSALGASTDPEDWATWFDFERWNDELAADIFKAAMLTSTSTGREAAAALGFDPDDYDDERVMALMREVARGRAEHINTSTFKALDEARKEEVEQTVEGVFDFAEQVRAVNGAKSLVTTFSSLGTVEAGQQLGGTGLKKTWRVTSKNPRPEHAHMDGETVPMSKNFSNGARWPGDPVLGVDGVSNCQCAVELQTP